MHYLIGIDEAGRGPWAGPIVVGGFLIRGDDFTIVSRQLPKLADSKVLNAKQRESIFHDIERLQFEQECQYAFSSRDAHEIDTLGIREANRQCMQDVILSLLQFVSHEDTVTVYIDGCDNYEFELDDCDYVFAKKRRRIDINDEIGKMREKTNKQKNLISYSSYLISVTYVIHGDSLVPVISAASIVAKVIRDAMMREFHEDFPKYGFAEHKGYGTRKHRDSLINYGITPIHRKSYAPVKSLISGHTSV